MHPLNYPLIPDSVLTSLQLRDIFLEIVDTDHYALGLNSSSVLYSSIQPACETSSTQSHPSHMQTADPPTSTRPVIDVLSWLTRAALDIIGEAGKIFIFISCFRTLIPVSGFGYSFHSLPLPGTNSYNASRPENELASAFAAIFSTSHTFSVLTVLTVWFPFLRRFVGLLFSIEKISGRSFSESSVQTLAHYRRLKPPCSALARSLSTSASPGLYRMNQHSTRDSRATSSLFSVRTQRNFPCPLRQRDSHSPC